MYSLIRYTFFAKYHLLIDSWGGESPGKIVFLRTLAQRLLKGKINWLMNAD